MKIQVKLKHVDFVKDSRAKRREICPVAIIINLDDQFTSAFFCERI